MSGYIVNCCICKEEIKIDSGKSIICQPVSFVDGEWKRVRLGKWKQFFMCITCLNRIIEIRGGEATE